MTRSTRWMRHRRVQIAQPASKAGPARSENCGISQRNWLVRLDVCRVSATTAMTCGLDRSRWRQAQARRTEAGFVHARRAAWIQRDLEPATLRLTAERRWFGSRVLRAGRSDENLVICGVRQRIVQRLFSARVQIAGRNRLYLELCRTAAWRGRWDPVWLRPKLLCILASQARPALPRHIANELVGCRVSGCARFLIGTNRVEPLVFSKAPCRFRPPVSQLIRCPVTVAPFW